MIGDALTDKRIWLTGATSGIGRQLALQLADLGNTVVISARREEMLTDLAQSRSGLVVCACDVSDRENVLSARDTIEKQIGAIDIVILNAGIAEYVEVDAFDSSVFERVFAVNFMGAIYTIEAALPLLRKSQKPYIVGVSSSAAYMALPRASAYGASKAALTHALESLAVDLAGEGIDVSVVSPGFIKTTMTDANDFPMPMLMDVDDAVQQLLRGMRKRQREIRFPRLFVYGLRLVSKLPVQMRHWLASRLSRS